jgi:hypothetical protein
MPDRRAIFASRLDTWLRAVVRHLDGGAETPVIGR